MIGIIEVIDYTILCIRVVIFWTVIVKYDCLNVSLVIRIECDGWSRSVVGFTFQIKITSILKRYCHFIPKANLINLIN